MFRILPNENSHFDIERFLCVTPPPTILSVLRLTRVCTFLLSDNKLRCSRLTVRFSSTHKYNSHENIVIITVAEKDIVIIGGAHEKRLIYPFPRVGPSVQQHYNTVIITVVTRKPGPWDAETFRPNHCVIYVIYARTVRHTVIRSRWVFF